MTTNTRTRRRVLPVAALLTLSFPLAVWGLVGRQDAQGVPRSELDYAVEPGNTPAGTETLVAVLAALLVVGCVALLVRENRAGTFDARWWQVLGPLLLAGAVAGAGWRVVTAGVLGANIGAGLVALLGIPLIAALVVWSLARGAWLAHRPSQRPAPRPVVPHA